MNLTISIILTIVMAALAISFFYMLQAKSARRATIATVRLIVQTSLVGGCAYGLMKIDNILLNLLWLVLTTLFAAWYVVMRARLNRRSMFVAVWGAMLAAVVVGILPMYSIGRVHQAALLIPVAGIVQCEMAVVLPRALKEYYVALVRFSDTYYYLLGNGTTWTKAVVPMLRRAVDRSFLPAYRKFSRAALVGLPLLMGGLLLAGTSPLTAVVATLLLTFSGLVATIVALLLIVVASRQVVTDKRGHLTDKARS
ncbi:MAG: ABC transporter permease [Prevotella sp.]|nr:ABC transporter permease [Prevotella sp.]